jgi:hypothetical protein
MMMMMMMKCERKSDAGKRGATGIISKSPRHYRTNIPGKHEIKKLQKTAILGTSHLL